MANAPLEGGGGGGSDSSSGSSGNTTSGDDFELSDDQLDDLQGGPAQPPDTDTGTDDGAGGDSSGVDAGTGGDGGPTPGEGGHVGPPGGNQDPPSQPPDGDGGGGMRFVGDDLKPPERDFEQGIEDDPDSEFSDQAAKIEGRIRDQNPDLDPTDIAIRLGENEAGEPVLQPELEPGTRADFARERFAEQNPQYSPEDLRVFGSGADMFVVPSDEARRREVAEQIASENPGIEPDDLLITSAAPEPGDETPAGYGNPFAPDAQRYEVELSASYIDEQQQELEERLAPKVRAREKAAEMEANIEAIERGEVRRESQGADPELTGGYPADILESEIEGDSPADVEVTRQPGYRPEIQQREQYGDVDWSFGLGGPGDEVEQAVSGWGQGARETTQPIADEIFKPSGVGGQSGGEWILDNNARLVEALGRRFGRREQAEDIARGMRNAGDAYEAWLRSSGKAVVTETSAGLASLPKTGLEALELVPYTYNEGFNAVGELAGGAAETGAAVVDQFKTNPGRATGALVGGVAIGAGFGRFLGSTRLATGRTGQLLRLTDPVYVGRRATGAAARTASRASARISDAAPSFRRADVDADTSVDTARSTRTAADDVDADVGVDFDQQATGQPARTQRGDTLSAEQVASEARATVRAAQGRSPERQTTGSPYRQAYRTARSDVLREADTPGFARGMTGSADDAATRPGALGSPDPTLPGSQPSLWPATVRYGLRMPETGAISVGPATGTAAASAGQTSAAAVGGSGLPLYGVVERRGGVRRYLDIEDLQAFVRDERGSASLLPDGGQLQRRRGELDEGSFWQDADPRRTGLEYERGSFEGGRPRDRQPGGFSRDPARRWRELSGRPVDTGGTGQPTGVSFRGAGGGAFFAPGVNVGATIGTGTQQGQSTGPTVGTTPGVGVSPGVGVGTGVGGGVRSWTDNRLDTNLATSTALNLRADTRLGYDFNLRADFDRPRFDRPRWNLRTPTPSRPPNDGGRPRPRLDDDEESGGRSRQLGRSGLTASAWDAPNVLGPGWASETLTTAALRGRLPGRTISQSALRDQPALQRLTGELPTYPMVSGSQETQDRIEDVRDVFTFN